MKTQTRLLLVDAAGNIDHSQGHEYKYEYEHGQGSDGRLTHNLCRPDVSMKSEKPTQVVISTVCTAQKINKGQRREAIKLPGHTRLAGLCSGSAIQACRRLLPLAQ